MVNSPGPPPVEPPARSARGVSPKMILALVIAAAAIWFAFANTRHARITFWVPTVSAPIWIVLLGTFLVGMLTGWLVTRHRRSP